ncbi:MAG: NosD domain-containing protein [Candidatus Goldiibacteriota bacterium]
MKKFIAALILSFFSAVCMAETKVPSEINTKEIWTAKNGPYLIENEVTIGSQGFVAVRPGTVIKFKENARLTVKGAFHSKGSPKNPVRLLPYDGSSFYEGIKIEGKYKNIMEFTVVIRGGIIVEGGNLILKSNYILNSTGVQIYHFANVIMTDNYMYNNTYGIYAEGQKIQMQIKRNTFNRNRFAVYLQDLKDIQINISLNNFIRNQVNITNYTANNIKAEENFWGTVNEKRIGSYLFDKRNNKKLGIIDFMPFKRAKLKLYTPPPSFVRLVKYYINLKRPDQIEPQIVIGFGADGFIPFAPENISSEISFGAGFDAELGLNLGHYALGVEGKMISAENSGNDEYDMSMNINKLMLNFYYYLGWKKNVFFIPYFKAGNGIALITREYRAQENIFNDNTSNTRKINEFSYTAGAGAGFEIYPRPYFSVRTEAVYNVMFTDSGMLQSAQAVITGNVHFNIPFFIGER